MKHHVKCNHNKGKSASQHTVYIQLCADKGRCLAGWGGSGGLVPFSFSTSSLCFTAIVFSTSSTQFFPVPQ